MTSNSVLSQFADLSPTQRQLLFEKIRQKKLNQARRPVSSDSQRSRDALAPSPVQQHILQATAGILPGNRVVEIQIQNALSATSLQVALSQLTALQPQLLSRLDIQKSSFLPAEKPPEISTVDLSATRQEEQHTQLHCLREALIHQPNEQHSLHLSLVLETPQLTRLLLACHPALMDNYSLLRLASRLIRDAQRPDPTTGNPLSQPLDPQPQQFAEWSEQMLTQDFLQTEWARLAKSSILPALGNGLQTQGIDTLSQQLDKEFIERYRPLDVSTKQWLCDAIHQCLGNWLSHQAVPYWFSDPQLKDNAFENLLGFFPYYVPLKGSAEQTSGNEETTSIQRLSQLHTRYSAVSEHLARQLCESGAASPLVHYHWFDVSEDDGSGAMTLGVEHLNNGLLLAPFEIHITEHSNGINLDIHYQRDQSSPKQLNMLIRDLKSLLRFREDSPQRPQGLPELVGAIWEDLLQVSDIEPDQSFFELGGHSLQVTELKFRIKQQLKLDIPISVLYELSTIEKLCNFIVATHGNSLGFVPDTHTQDDDEEEGTL